MTTPNPGPAVGGWRSFRPSRLQLSPAHEQCQFSRLTSPGSVLGHFHEKGRVARLSWDVPHYPYTFRRRTCILRETICDNRARSIRYEVLKEGR